MANLWETVGEHHAISINKGDVIFQGTFCRILGGISLFDGTKVAVKKIDHQRTDYQCEVETLSKLRHPHIVHYHYKDEDQEYVYIVLERCICSLQDWLQKNVRAAEIKNYKPDIGLLGQITDGLRFLHYKKIIHRDLHPSNVLLSLDVDMVIAKISDFGVVKKAKGDGMSMSHSGPRGSKCYQAPEVIRGEHISEKSDIFSLGLIFFNIITEQGHPFGNNTIDIEVNIRDGEPPDLRAIAGKCKGYATPLISSMLCRIKEERPSASEVLAHYLFWDSNKTVLFLQNASDFLWGKGAIVPHIRDRLSKMSKAQKVFDGNWRSKLLENMSEAQQKIVTEERLVANIEVFGLLKQIRNWAHHYDEKSDEFKQIIGLRKCDMLDFFMERFPSLLPCVYEVFDERKSCEDFDTCVVWVKKLLIETCFGL